MPIVFGSRGLSVPEGVMAVVMMDAEVTVVEVELEKRTLDEATLEEIMVKEPVDDERTGVVEVETELDGVDELIALIVDDDDALP